MKVRFNRWYNALLTALLSMLGFESCKVSGNEPVSEYGCPHADYIVKGIITDEAGSPVQGIKVSVKEGLDDPYTKESVLTDAAGCFQFQEMTSFNLNPGEALVVEDIDGEAYGSYKSDTISLKTLPKIQTEKGSGWYKGKFELTADIKLKKKE